MTDRTVPTFSLVDLREGRNSSEFRRCLPEMGVFYMRDHGASWRDHQCATDTPP